MVTVFNQKRESYLITVYEVPQEKKERYSFTLSLTSVICGAVGQRHLPAVLPPERNLIAMAMCTGRFRSNVCKLHIVATKHSGVSFGDGSFYDD